MRRYLVVLFLALLPALSACGPGAARVSLAPDEYGAADWESGFADAELTVWREGCVRRVLGTPQADISRLPTVEGAVVALYAAHPAGRRPLRKLAEATTGPDGRFRIGPGPARSWVLCAQEGDGIATWAGNVRDMIGAFPQPEGEVTVLVRDGHELDVRVVDGAGSPLPGALLRARTVGYEQETTSDAQGFARFRAPPGEVWVDALDAHRFGATRRCDVPAPDGAAPYELVAPDRGHIEGWVRDAATGEPLGGAVVVHAWRHDLVTVADPDGRFSLEAPRQGRIAAFGRGRAWRSYVIPDVGDVEIRLEPGIPCAGPVPGPDGAPVAGARLLAAVRTAAGGDDRVLGPVTRDDGTFRFDWLPRPPRGSSGRTLVVAHRRGVGWSPPQVVADAAAPLTLRLGGERAVQGVVRDAGGAPRGGAYVVVRAPREGVTPAEETVLELVPEITCATGADGTYVARGLPADVAAALTLTLETVRLERRAEPGGDARIDIDLPAGKPISGRVVDVAGQPVLLGGTVRAELLNHPELARLEREVPLRPDGTFEIPDLPQGTYGVRAAVPTYSVSGAVLEPGASDVELVAERPSQLDFELVFPDGAVPEPVVVELRSATDPAVPPRSVRIDPAAGSTGGLPLVRRGRYHVHARGGAWRCELLDHEVPDGRRPPLRLVLARTLVRSIVLEGTGGEPLSGRRVVVAPIGNRTVAPEVHYTGEGGTTDIGGLAEGEWVARVIEEGRPLIEHRFTVSAADASEIVLRYPPHGSLEVFVDRERLADPAGAFVSILDGDGRPAVAWGPGARELASRWRVPAEGGLLLRGLPVGTYTVRVASTASDSVERSTDVSVGGRASLRLP